MVARPTPRAVILDQDPFDLVLTVARAVIKMGQSGGLHLLRPSRRVLPVVPAVEQAGCFYRSIHAVGCLATDSGSGIRNCECGLRAFSNLLAGNANLSLTDRENASDRGHWMQSIRTS
jgi:hypothetical protein